MKAFSFDFTQPYVDLYLMGDIHLGDANCKTDLLMKDIQEIQKNKYAKVILMGDLLNCGTKHSVGEGPFSESHNTQSQYEQALEIFSKIRDKTLLSLLGNHEQRIINETSINPIKNMCAQLGIEYGGYSSFVDIKVNTQMYKLFVCHGAGGSAKLPSKVAKLMSLSKTFFADFYASGHTHELVLTKDLYRISDGKNILEKTRFYQITGSYLGYDHGYAEMKLLEPAILGCAKVRLYGKEWGIDNLVK